MFKWRIASYPAEGMWSVADQRLERGGGGCSSGRSRNEGAWALEPLSLRSML